MLAGWLSCVPVLQCRPWCRPCYCQWVSRRPAEPSRAVARQSALCESTVLAGVRRRYTVPALAASRRVFAPCLLGFGWSDKPLVEYDGYDVWPRQLAAFIREVGAACRAHRGQAHVLAGALPCCLTSGS